MLATFLTMQPEIRVLYNDTCPVCRREVDVYRSGAAAQGLPIAFDGLDRAGDWGLTADAAARQFHVRQGDVVLAGMPAFRALWSEMPGWRWLARVTGWPVMRGLCDLVYRHVAAPVLYRAHLRRQARRVPAGLAGAPDGPHTQ